jgi:predicted RNA-binding protein
LENEFNTDTCVFFPCMAHFPYPRSREEALRRRARSNVQNTWETAP